MFTNPNRFSSKLSIIEATIPNGQTESSIIHTAGSTMVGIIFPFEFDHPVVNFLASVDDGATFQQMFKLDGSVEEIPVSLDGNALVDFQAFARVEVIKIITNVPQTADRQLKIITRDYA